MTDIFYDIWFSLCFPAGSEKPKKIAIEFPGTKGIREFYENYEKDTRVRNILSEKDIKAIKMITAERIEEIAEKCEKSKADIIGINCPDYPESLRNISNPPAALYVKGSIKGLDDELVLTIVGTRLPSGYANSVTGNLSFQLSRAGAVITSGCAEGLDTLAHLGALKAGRPTIGVLACGIDVDYPKSNAELKEAIIENGAIITELPPGRSYYKGYFHARNRILAGISAATIITQASERSGALITARHAIEQGKDVFCVPPHDIYDADFAGASELYAQGGCYMAVSAKFILDTYSQAWGHKLNLELASSASITEKEKGVKLPGVKSVIVEKRPKWEKDPNVNRSAAVKRKIGKSGKNPEFVRMPVMPKTTKESGGPQDDTFVRKLPEEAEKSFTAGKPSGLNKIQIRIWEEVRAGADNPNDLAEKIGAETGIGEIAAELTMLEIMGYLEKDITGKYILC